MFSNRLKSESNGAKGLRQILQGIAVDMHVGEADGPRQSSTRRKPGKARELDATQILTADLRFVTGNVEETSG